MGAIAVSEKALIDSDTCIGCGECTLVCPQSAVQIQWTESPEAMQEKMVEHAYGALHGKQNKCIFLNVATQVSPACDCYGHSDAPIVGDIGFLAATDPVAVDQASVDQVNAQNGNPSSCLQGNFAPGEDKFRAIYPDIDWSIQLRHAENLGLGNRRYLLHDSGQSG